MNLSPSAGNKTGSMGPPTQPQLGLSRYVSAPGSLLSGIADSVIASGGGGGVEFLAARSEGMMSRFLSGDSSCLTSESSCRTAAPAGGPDRVMPALQRSHGFGEIRVVPDRSGPSRESPLVRHSSSPAGFLSHLLVDHQGHSAMRGIGNYSQADTSSVQSLESRRLRSQWSFSRQDSLSQISELSIPEIGENVSSDEAPGHARQSYISSNFQRGSWQDNNSIVFSASPSKRANGNNGNRSLSNIESQFSLPKTSLEMSSVENYLQMQQDSVPWKIRAKRGCATHPRSIAERERRTRISKRLRKLQDLVPNMDKQTSTSDMLEFAIQHIKQLQNQVQRLKQEQADCTCGGKQEKA